VDGLVNGLGAASPVVGGRRDFLRLRDAGGRPIRELIEFKHTWFLAPDMPAKHGL
jgi:hypothetical protein